MSSGAEQASLSATAAGACEPLRMQVTLEPDQTDALIQQCAYRKIDHISMIPRPARWLHMSLSFYPKILSLNSDRGVFIFGGLTETADMAYIA